MDVHFVRRFKTGELNPVVIETDERKSIGELELVTQQHVQNIDLLEQVCDWHNRAIHFYSDQKKWSPDSTAEWLTKIVIPCQSRLLFFVRSDSGDRLGLCGLSKIEPEQAEVYDIVRGGRGGHALLFPYAQIAMLRLSFYGIDLRAVHGAIHRDNVAARRMGHFVGFEEFGSLPVIPSNHGPTANPTQVAAAFDLQIRLCITRDQLQLRHPGMVGMPRFRGSCLPVTSCVEEAENVAFE